MSSALFRGESVEGIDQLTRQARLESASNDVCFQLQRASGGESKRSAKKSPAAAAGESAKKKKGKIAAATAAAVAFKT